MDVTHLPELVDTLMSKAHSARSGRAAQTLNGDSHHRLRQTIIALTAKSVLAEHKGPGEATLQVLRGHVTLTVGDTSITATDGDLVTIPVERHDLSAEQDSVFILTVVTDGR